MSSRIQLRNTLRIYHKLLEFITQFSRIESSTLGPIDAIWRCDECVTCGEERRSWPNIVGVAFPCRKMVLAISVHFQQVYMVRLLLLQIQLLLLWVVHLMDTPFPLSFFWTMREGIPELLPEPRIWGLQKSVGLHVFGHKRTHFLLRGHFSVDEDENSSTLFCVSSTCGYAQLVIVPTW